MDTSWPIVKLLYISGKTDNYKNMYVLPSEKKDDSCQMFFGPGGKHVYLKVVVVQ